MISQWISNALWDGVKLFAGRVHDYFFDPVRAAKRRFADREKWWAYKIKSEQTKDKRDDMRAEWFRIRFDFETSPQDAVKRGDLDPAARQMAIDAVNRALAAKEWQGPAADRAQP
jgi:hypothetical protein